ncbi:MAG: TonB-dependent receptor [Acidobacteriota bacterium]
MLIARAAIVVAATGLATGCGGSAPPAEPPAATVPGGTIRGHVRLTGTPPANPSVWLHEDKMCVAAHAGAPVIQQAYATDAEGRLANVFVRLLGTFPDTPVPTEPVAIDQRDCLYVPRMVGLRAGQRLVVSNSDPGPHNVHGISTGRDGFNVLQPERGMTNEFILETEGILRLMCDLHPWMISFIGVAKHPYFAVSGADGVFELRDVPPGEHTVEAWHERLGVVTARVRVESEGVAEVALEYASPAPPTPDQG